MGTEGQVKASKIEAIYENGKTFLKKVFVKWNPAVTNTLYKTTALVSWSKDGDLTTTENFSVNVTFCCSSFKKQKEIHCDSLANWKA